MRASAKWDLLVIWVIALSGTVWAQGPSAKKYPTITDASFGFQCGTGKLTNCPEVTWPTTIAQPGMIRLWDSQVQWHALNPGPGNYKWTLIDAYLDAIVAHQPRAAMYTFGYTPCWDTTSPCERRWGSVSPPDDLTTGGSPSFNAFVNALVTHCSAAGHCVKDYIKYWEMWNEANAPHYWNGSVAQLYNLMAPAVAIIRRKVPEALILTPPVSMGNTEWMQEWLNQENSGGRLADIYGFHLYLQNKTPEERFSIVQSMIQVKDSTPGWRDTPWMNTETSFEARTFACSSYTPEDCAGQIVRWHLLHFAAGGEHLGWYYFNTTIGRNPDFSNAYHFMMRLLVGGHFTAECSASGSVYTCPFVETNGHHALFAWNVSGQSAYNPPAQYVAYKDLAGNATKSAPGRPVTIGVKPIMLEAAN
ncbi:MAG: hypothetical protein WBZ11_14180 [Candidatus Sulfotelmatobacter sp.]|jgi:hypothetical protein